MEELGRVRRYRDIVLGTRRGEGQAVRDVVEGHFSKYRISFGFFEEFLESNSEDDEKQEESERAPGSDVLIPPKLE